MKFRPTPTILLAALLATTGCGGDDDDSSGLLSPTAPSPVTGLAAQDDSGRQIDTQASSTALLDGARASTTDKRTINFEGVNWEWNAKSTHLEPDSFPDARVDSRSNVWRRDDGTGLIRIFSDADLDGMTFSTAGGSWPLSMRRAGLYVSSITGTEVDQISTGGGGSGGRNEPRNEPRTNHPALQCWPSDTSRAPRLAANSAYAGLVSFVITITCNREVDGSTEENAIRAAAGTAAHFYAAVPDASETPPWSQGTTEATWVTKTPASVDLNTSGTSGMNYAVSLGFSIQRNETGSLRAGHLVWDPTVPSGVTKPTLTARLVQQAAADIECTLPTVRSFSARAVDPRHNRITWNLPNQSSSCEYTALQLDVVTPSRSSVVQISPPGGHTEPLDQTEYIHGALPTCPEERCGALTDDEAVVTYKIRTTDFGNHNAGPWSREVTVNRSTAVTPTAPLYMRAIHQDSGHVLLRWDEPAIPEDGAGVTYSVEASARGGAWRSWTNFTNEGPLTRTISFADMPPLGVETPYRFRVRATHNGRSGPWSNETDTARTWDAPGAVTVQLGNQTGDVVGAKGEQILNFRFAPEDSHRRSGYGTGTAEECAISVGNRSSYQVASISTNGLDCVPYALGNGGFSGLKLEWLAAGWPGAVNQTIWMRFALRRGSTIYGPTQEVDITRNSDNKLVSQNATTFGGGGGSPDPDPCSNGMCNQPPDPPWSEATSGDGYLTMRWTTTTNTGYFPGTNSSGNEVSIRRMEMKYEACPHYWNTGRRRFERIGPAVGADDTNCRTGTGTGRSTGSITFRGSFGVIDGMQVDMWEAKMNAMAVNSLGRPSPWAGWTGGHVVQD